MDISKTVENLLLTALSICDTADSKDCTKCSLYKKCSARSIPEKIRLSLQ